MRFMTENGRQSASRLSVLGALLILLSGGCSLVAESARQAAQYMERGQYEASMRAYEALAAKNPKDGRFFYNAGVAAYKAQQFKEAQQFFDAASLSSDLLLQQQSFYNRGNALYREGE